MCEQTPVEYKNGDIVWVKLGSCWWPGEVQDLNSISEETIAGFKKPIIAAVKFFDEDYYEYIKSLDRIYYYNCSKKNEFIKKGLDLHRAKHEYMKKFPEDVSKAEERTNGNPNIIDDPVFAPEKKTNIAALIFGSPKPKKSPKKSIGSNKKSIGSKSPASTKKTPINRLITHPRFLGQDDHEVRILVQTPEQREPSEEEAVIYKCQCGFSTVRVDVAIMHRKSHIQGYLTPKSLPNTKKRSAFKKNKKPLKMTKSKTSTIIEDFDLIAKGKFFESESSDTDSVGHNLDRGPKRKKKRNNRKPVKKEEPKNPNTVVDIRGDLLAEWDEEESDTEKNDTLNTSVESELTDNKTIELKNHQVDKEVEDLTKGNKSCFDFEEDDEEQIIGTSLGRKIPRVIPPPDRPKSTDSLEIESDIPISENNPDSLQSSAGPSQSSLCSSDEAHYDSGSSGQEMGSSEDSLHVGKDLSNIDCTLNKNDIMKIIHQVEDAKEDVDENAEEIVKKDENCLEKDKSENLDEDAFKDILDATTVPDVPEIPHSLICDSETTKLPHKLTLDITLKPEVKDTHDSMSTKLINPKKRFVKSFEDFEQQIHKEQKKLLELEQSEKIQDATVEDSKEDKLAHNEETSSLVPELKEDEAESDFAQKITSTVEVSKLKTQLKNKLESAEPTEGFSSKPKRPRLLRDRILSNLKEECEQLHKQSSNLLVNHPEVIETSSLLSCPNTRSSSMETYDIPEELIEPAVDNDTESKVPPEYLPVLEIVELAEPSTTVEESIGPSPDSDLPPTQPTEKDVSVVCVSEEIDYSSKPRRLSIKMSEIGEFEIKETAELLELEEQIQLQPSQVLENKDTIDAIKMEQLRETQTEVSNDGAVTGHKAMDKMEHSVPTLQDSDKMLNGEEPVISNMRTDVFAAYESGALTIVQEDANSDLLEKNEECLQTEEVVHSNILSAPCISFTRPNLDNQNPEDLSALTTLATVSELTTNFDMHSALPSEKSKVIEENLTFVDKPSSLNFVTMSDLAEGQVEISDVCVSKVKSKPISLTNFSVDFGDSGGTIDSSGLPCENLATSMFVQDNENEDDMNQPDSIEMSLGKVFEGENDTEEVASFNLGKRNSRTRDSGSADLDEQIPSLVIRNSKQSFKKLKTKAIYEKIVPPEYSSSSKLLEILTDGKPKPTATDTSTVPQKTVTANVCTREENIRNVSVDSPTFCKSSTKMKEDGLFGACTEGLKTVSKAKDEKHFTVPASINKTLPKSKDEKVYSLSKDSPTIAKHLPKFESKNAKFILRSSSSLKSFTPPPFDKTHKPIILSEKIIKTLSEPSESVSVQKVTSKHTMQDFEDIDAYIIQRPSKKLTLHEELPETTEPASPKKGNAPRGKAKILQQTIIKPAASELTQPTATASLDDSMFDINSMPIVLGDQILTTEGIENMPVVLSEAQAQPTTTVASTKVQADQKVLLSNKTATSQPLLLKTYSTQKLGKSRIYQTTATSTTKILKSNPAVISRQGKHDKYIILPSGAGGATTSKYTVGKRQSVTKRMTPVILPTPNVTQKLQGTVSSEPSGNKIMIVTNQQGQQSRVLLTPAQQKMFGYQTPASGSKLVKSTLKGNILQKTSAKSSVISSVANSLQSSSNKVSNIVSHTLVNSQGEILATTSQSVTSTDATLIPVKSTALRSIKSDVPKTGRKFQVQQQKLPLHDTFKGSSVPGQQKTIVIKNQQGQIVKKFQGTDDAFLEQQVAEQVQAIKASGSFSTSNIANKMKPPIKRSYPKKSETGKNLKLISNIPKKESVPPLAPISPKRTDSLLLSQSMIKSNEIKMDQSSKQDLIQQKPLNQLIIQDALGNQTTIMEGQILALPSGETVDGQPQSYMLVTLDESGNLAPLNNEALLSLDPNLSLGGDLSNMVLQVDDGTLASKKSSIDSSKIIAGTAAIHASPNNAGEAQMKIIQESPQLPKERILVEATAKLETEPSSGVEGQQNVQTVTCSIGHDPNQQLIITGDPISTQKFIESLTEGNPDLANLLASAEGNILIQTDEQQILINTDAENQVMLPLNSERLDTMDNSESNSNPIFANQPMKNQDILAAALADTDVFQQEQIVSPVHSKMGQAQLSPTGGLYQAGVSNVLETTLSLSSPIMTPLEVPSTNNKKIPDEEMDILTTEVPKNVDLPITITDPNISQTVAQQQAVSLLANELTSTLDLPLSISEQVVAPLTSAEIHSPSYGFPLSSLDESVQKSFSGPISMPLLTEDPQDTAIDDTIVEEVPEEIIEVKGKEIIATSEACVTVDDSLNENKQLTSPPPAEEETSTINRNKLFENSSLTDSIIKEDSRSSPKSFLGTSMESEEGLCTLGGAMCSSLSEPPPDMFDLSLVGSHFVTESEIKISIGGGEMQTESMEAGLVGESTSIDQIDSATELNGSNEEFNKFESYDINNKMDHSILNAPLNSVSSSPVVNVDENSCEIPVQPQIVTDLSSSSFESVDVSNFESSKRVASDFGTESDRKKIKFD